MHENIISSVYFLAITEFWSLQMSDIYYIALKNSEVFVVSSKVVMSYYS